ncbi:hypothetical protein OG339_08755 [Streptosporangium sp. NBC_01495]|uniref:hypothetical protein n=1 Tax=Streptosporangium sp. NBC_01495 TaxID=2903899 RepID=UPI002E33BE15|nr:hypothetical protein [Streptosporangium sp. NBC_01495]
MDSAIEVFGFLVGVSGGLFVLITLLVTMPGRMRDKAARSTSAGAVWLGGPFGSERGITDSVLVLTERRPVRPPAPEIDWVSLAETSEPGRHTGGASAAW